MLTALAILSVSFLYLSVMVRVAGLPEIMVLVCFMVCISVFVG